jgi:hypothetical protein
MPGASITYLYDIDGSNIVGIYVDSIVTHGLLYDGTTWTALDILASSSVAYGIDGDKIVGTYKDAQGISHGFIYSIPEPATVLLFGFGVPILSRLRKRRKALNVLRSAFCVLRTEYCVVLYAERGTHDAVRVESRNRSTQPADNNTNKLNSRVCVYKNC